jgi:hypothetical protein
MTIYDKVFGEKHGKDLWKLTLEEMKMLSDARKPETERRHKLSAKIKANNLRSKAK